MVRHVPDLLGPPEPITTEPRYCAFPSVTRAADGAALVAYRHGAGHATVDGQLRVRRSDTGSGWSAPAVLADEPGDYSWGPAGMVAETAEAGGRVYLAAVRYRGSTTGSASDYSTHLLTRSAAGTWSRPARLPDVIAAGQTYPSDVHIHAGELLVAVYGTPPGATRWVARVMVSADGGATWSTRGTLTLTDRPAAEPQLETLADGRLVMVVRGDAPAPYYCYLYRAYSSDAGRTWTTPEVVVTHGTGLPALHVLPDTGEIAILYRGFSEPVNPPDSWPLAVAMLHPDATAQRPVQEQGLDVLVDDDRRVLYVGVIPGLPARTPAVPDQLVWSAEAPDANTAAVYTAPITWAPLPA